MASLRLNAVELDSFPAKRGNVPDGALAGGVSGGGVGEVYSLLTSFPADHLSLGPEYRLSACSDICARPYNNENCVK